MGVIVIARQRRKGVRGTSPGARVPPTRPRRRTPSRFASSDSGDRRSRPTRSDNQPPPLRAAGSPAASRRESGGLDTGPRSRVSRYHGARDALLSQRRASAERSEGG